HRAARARARIRGYALRLLLPESGGARSLSRSWLSRRRHRHPAQGCVSLFRESAVEGTRMTVRMIAAADRAAWCGMRDALWPGSLADHEKETRDYFERAAAPFIVFVAEADGRPVGFLELNSRSYAPGCESSPVPFIEGWYVDASYRG